MLEVLNEGETERALQCIVIRVDLYLLSTPCTEIIYHCTLSHVWTELVTGLLESRTLDTDEG